MKECVLFLNPSAGKGRSKKSRARIEKILKSFKIKYDLFVSKSEEDLRNLIRQFYHQYKTIVCVGGDTTFNIIATEILEKKIPAENSPNLGFIGTGSANDICQSLGLNSIEMLCDSIIKSRIKKMDAGMVRVNGKNRRLFFLGSMSLGLGSTVNTYIEEFSRRHKFLSGSLFFAQRIGGALGILNSFSKNKLPLSAKLRFNQTVEYLNFSLMVFLNTNYYARGLNLSPDTNAFDGQMDCVAITTDSTIKTLKFYHWVKKGNHRGKKGFRVFRSNRFLLTSEKKIDIQLDGEIVKGVNECEVSVLPQVLNVFAK